MISTRTRPVRRLSLLAMLVITTVAVLAFGSSAAQAMPADGGTSTNPWIQSDQLDYAPGSTVTLTGGNWQPGENVHIFVDDTNGHTWNHSADVTADDAGRDPGRVRPAHVVGRRSTTSPPPAQRPASRPRRSPMEGEREVVGVERRRCRGTLVEHDATDRRPRPQGRSPRPTAGTAPAIPAGRPPFGTVASADPGGDVRRHVPQLSSGNFTPVGTTHRPRNPRAWSARQRAEHIVTLHTLTATDPDRR